MIFLSISANNIAMSENKQKIWLDFKASRKYQNILNDPLARIYLVDKPKKVNSFRAVSILRKLLNIKRIGFAGTLDPLASGLLILATGKATQLLDYFHYLPKVYQADILFGQTSSTYDLEVEPEVNDRAKAFSKAELLAALKKFDGKISQRAPIFSAKKVNGQKLYRLARAGKKIKAPVKEVEIYKAEIMSFKYPQAKIKVTCSAGTYIRSLANDLGEELKTGALLSDLRRTEIGKFLVKDSLILDQIDKKFLDKNFILPEKAISSLDQYFFQ